jgi:hypothetical protein
MSFSKKTAEKFLQSAHVCAKRDPTRGRILLNDISNGFVERLAPSWSRSFYLSVERQGICKSRSETKGANP